MSRINTNVPSLVARGTLNRTSGEMQLRLERLSTGLRINRGADDPAGLIISERLRSDIKGVQQAISNADRASSVIATTEGALAEVNDLLSSIRALVVQAANTGAMSNEEIKANQLQIDSAIDSITRISNTATFGGLKLLNGSLDYNLSSIANSAIATAQIFGASFVGESNLRVDVDVVASAQVGALYLRGDLPTPGDPQNGTILSTTTLRIAGNRGVAEITLTSGASYDDLMQAVNKLSSLTGVQAVAINPGDLSSGITFRSSEYGTTSFVSVQRVNGPPTDDDSFATYSLASNAAVPAAPPFPWNLVGTTLTADNRDEGQDVRALVNGTLATGEGLRVSVNSQSLSLEMLLTEDAATIPTSSATSFYITGGGALFQLGPSVGAQQQSNIGIQSVAASLLGGTLVDGQLQYLSTLKLGQTNSLQNSAGRKDFSAASDIIDKAIDQTSILRGRLGAFEKNTLQTNVRSLQTAYENLSASDSQIRDADFATETSALTRAQILQASGTSVLALANQQSQSVLQLLG
jgi:flagellin